MTERGHKLSQVLLEISVIGDITLIDAISFVASELAIEQTIVMTFRLKLVTADISIYNTFY